MIQYRLVKSVTEEFRHDVKQQGEVWASQSYQEFIEPKEIGSYLLDTVQVDVYVFFFSMA